MLDEIARCLRRATARDVGRRRDRDDRNLVADANGDHVAFQPLGVPNAGIEPPGYDVGQGAVGGDLHSDLGIRDEKAADIGDQPQIGNGRCDAEAHSTRGLLAKIVHQIERSAIVVKNGPQPRQQPFAGHGRRHRARLRSTNRTPSLSSSWRTISLTRGGDRFRYLAALLKLF